MPGSARDIRAFDAADERSADVLAGRTVWCTVGHPAAGAAAPELGACLGGAGRALTAAALPVQGPDGRLRALAQKIDEMITGHGAGSPGLSRRDGPIYSRAATESEGLIGDGVCPGDVVVVVRRAERRALRGGARPRSACGLAHSDRSQVDQPRAPGSRIRGTVHARHRCVSPELGRTQCARPAGGAGGRRDAFAGHRGDQGIPGPFSRRRAASPGVANGPGRGRSQR